MSKRIGPSMSTEPGWMAAVEHARYYLRSAPARAANDPSMLLSFERPAPAGTREDASTRRRDRKARGHRPAFTPLHGP
jgi:hypothetical protein